MKSKFNCHFYRKHSLIIGALLLSALLRLVVFILLGPWDPEIESKYLIVTDQSIYHNMAISIKSLNFGGESSWMPGWPAFVALIYSIFGDLPWIVLLVNIVLSAVTILLLYHSVKLLLDERIGAFTAFFLACDPHQIVYSQTLYSENLFLPLLLLFFYLLIRYHQFSDLSMLIYSAAVAGCLVYIKSVALYIYIIPISLILIECNHEFKRRIKKVLLVFVIVFLVHTPMSFRNYLNDGYWQVTSNGGYNALFVYAGSVYTNQLGFTSEEKDKILQKRLNLSLGPRITNQFAYDEAAKRLACDIISEFPVEYIINHLNGCANIYSSLGTYNFSVILGIKDDGLFKPENYGSSHFGMVSDFMDKKSTMLMLVALMLALNMLIQYGLAMVSFTVVIKKEEFKKMIIPLLFILYFTLITGVIGSSARFKLPITPFYLIFSAYGLSYLTNFWKQHNKNSHCT